MGFREAWLPPSLLLLLVLAPGCGDLLAFDVTAEVEEFVVPGDVDLHHGRASLGQMTIPPVEVQIDAPVDSGAAVRLRALTFRVVDEVEDGTDDGQTDSLDFLTRLEVWIQPTDPHSVLAARRVGTWSGPASAGCRDLSVSVDPDVDLRHYLGQGFALQLRTWGVVPYDDVRVAGSVLLEVDPI